MTFNDFRGTLQTLMTSVAMDPHTLIQTTKGITRKITWTQSLFFTTVDQGTNGNILGNYAKICNAMEQFFIQNNEAKILSLPGDS